MKKTEKIEIRVSPEEKEALAEASRRQGRTASDVLREHVRAYIAAAARVSDKSAGDRKEKKMSWISKAAYIALGAGLSVPAVLFAAAESGPSEPGFEVQISLAEPTGEHKRAHYRASARIPLGGSKESMMVMPNVDGAGYQITVLTEKNADKTYHFIFSICRETDDECAVVSTPRIITAFGGHSTLSVQGANDTEINIAIVSREA
jgi:hypothetical protein